MCKAGSRGEGVADCRRRFTRREGRKALTQIAPIGVDPGRMDVSRWPYGLAHVDALKGYGDEEPRLGSIDLINSPNDLV